MSKGSSIELVFNLSKRPCLVLAKIIRCMALAWL